MDSESLESYLNNIGELVVDEGKIVTYKFLSRRFGLHVNTAKQLLHTYLSKHKTENSFAICATYLLAGKLSDGSFNVTIVNEGDLKNKYSKFSEITSEHVYSVQKGNGMKDLMVLCGIDKQSNNVKSSKNVIKCSKSVFKSKGKPDLFEINPTKVQVKNGFTEEKKVEDAKEPMKKIESPVKILKEITAKSPKKTSPSDYKSKLIQEKKDGQDQQNKPRGSIANFFANTIKKKPEKLSGASKTCVSESANGKNKSPPVVIAEKEDKIKRHLEQKSSTPQENIKKKKEGSKRKRIQVFSDSEENDDSSEEKSLPEEKEEEENSEPVVSRINLNEVEVNDKIPRNKKKKRKMIDKTVMNEDGYLETKKEIVFETDSEKESATEDEEKDPNSKKNFQQKKSKVTEKNKVVPSRSTATKQASLFNFFKRN